MNWLVTLIVALLRAFLPALVQASKDTSEDAAPQKKLRDRLRACVRRTWGPQRGRRAARMWPLIPIAVCLLAGCATRTIYVPDGTPVRLRETVRDAKVWVLSKDGKTVPGRMDLPEGWYALPPEPEEE